MRESTALGPHAADDTTRPARPRGTVPLAAAGATLLVVGHVLLVTHARPLSDLWYSFVWYGFIFAVDAVIAWRTGASLLTKRPGDAAFLLVTSCALWWGFESANLHLFASWSYSPSPDVSPLAQRVRSSVAFASLVPAVLEAGMLASLVMPRRRSPVAPATTTPRSFQLRSGRRPSLRPAPARFLASAAAVGLALLALAIAAPTYALPPALVGAFLVADATNAMRGRPSLLDRAWARDVRFAVALVVGNVAAGVVGEAWNYRADPKWTYEVPYADTFKIFEMPWPGYAGYGALALTLFALHHAVRPRLRGAAVAPGHPLAEAGLE